MYLAIVLKRRPKNEQKKNPEKRVCMVCGVQATNEQKTKNHKVGKRV